MASEPSVKPTALTLFLRGRDARCPECGYSLRGCESQRCPECGAELHLTIDSRNSATAWWWAGVMGSLASVGLSLWLLAILSINIASVLKEPGILVSVRAGLASTSELPKWRSLIAVAALLILSIALAGYFLSRRRKFSEWPALKQLQMGGLGLISPLVLLALLAAAMHLM